MPYLRFTRDKRGYENTFVMHSYRRRGRGRTRLLYWFRTPPNVRVGRAPLDEDAIRALEEGNPDLIFDWRRILDVQKSIPAATRSLKPPRRPPQAQARGEDVAAQQVEPSREQLGLAPSQTEDIPGAAEPTAAELASNVSVQTAPRASLTVLDPESLARFRSRYSELLARISQRVTDPGRLEQLRLEAERLNPDTWVTVEEVQEALAAFETVFEGIRAKLDRRRRRRRRGRKRASSDQISTKLIS